MLFRSLVGGGDEDIIIGGSTIYDDDLVALDEILAEWTSSNSHTDRLDNLQNGIGVPQLSRDQIISDRLVDKLRVDGLDLIL